MSRRIPEGWSYWCEGGPGYEIAWSEAVALKQTRERLRPDVFVRVTVVQGPGTSRWILRKEEPKARGKTR